MEFGNLPFFCRSPFFDAAFIVLPPLLIFSNVNNNFELVQYIEHLFFNNLSLVILIMSIGALAKNGSFGFAEGSALCVGEKPNVPLVRLAKIVFKKCAVGKKIKHEALGCRVGKKSDVKFICRPIVSIIFCQFNGCCVVCYACL